MLLMSTAQKENTIRGLFVGIPIYSHGIEGFIEQWTAFTRLQSATLQSQNFNLRVESARKIPYSRS